jgi:hypothetical protein
MKRPRRENFLNPKFKDTIEVFLHNLAIINNCKKEFAQKLSSEYAEEISIKLAKEIINNIDSKLNYHYNKDTEVDNIEK